MVGSTVCLLWQASQAPPAHSACYNRAVLWCTVNESIRFTLTVRCAALLWRYRA